MKPYATLAALALIGALVVGCSQKPRGEGVLPRETPPPAGAPTKPAGPLTAPPSR